MKEGIHPEYHEINIVMTDGTKYKTRSTWGKAGDTLQLDVDSKSHPAWVGGVNLRKTGQMEKFANKFGALSSLNREMQGDKPAAKAEAPKAAETKAAAPKADKKADKKPADKKAAAAKEEKKDE